MCALGFDIVMLNSESFKSVYYELYDNRRFKQDKKTLSLITRLKSIMKTKVITNQFKLFYILLDILLIKQLIKNVIVHLALALFVKKYPTIKQ